MSPEGSPLSDAANDVLRVCYSPEVVAVKTQTIHEAMRRNSTRVTTGNFTRIANADLQLLYELYDEHFFAGAMQRLIAESGAPLVLKFSPRLTRSGGLTKRFAPRTALNRPEGTTRFEIVLSSTLLFQTFNDIDRVVRVNGLVCADRLEAAQRIFEHELLHLTEMLLWGRSSCDAQPFKSLAWNLFAHTQTKHDLVTQHERANVQFGVRVGDLVTFTFEERRYQGRVNRITRRATVLVEDARGEPYIDGKRYLKFYIPLTMLEKAK